MSFRPLQSQAPVESRNIPQTAATAKVRVADRDQARRHGLLILAMFVAAGLIGLLATTVSGQGFDQIPMHDALKDPDNVKKCVAETKAFATTGGGNRSMVGWYFTRYVPAKMTGPDSIREMTDLMSEVNVFMARAARTNRPGVAQEVTKQVYAGMKNVAEGNYHPVARINAALLLGRLNRVPANSATRTPPVPLIQTLPILMTMYSDENNVDGVRAAALQGIHRHAMYGFGQIPDAQKTQLTAMMNDLLDAPTPNGRPENAHAYLQRYAVDIIDRLRDDQDKSLGTKLVSISTEPSKPNLIALYTASRIGSWGSELNGQVDKPEDVLQSWSRRAFDAFTAEVERLNELERTAPVRDQPMKPEDFLTKNTDSRKARSASMDDMDGMMGMDDMDGYEEGMMGGMEEIEEDGMDDMMMMMGMSGGMGLVPEANPQPPEVIASRQRLNTVLQQLQLGATGSPTPGMPRAPGGLLLSVADDKKKVVEDWVTAMEAVLTTLNEKTLDDREKYLEGLEGQLEPLRDLAGVEAEVAPVNELNAIDGMELDELDAAAEPETADEPNLLDELQ
ncbi:MAG: hypothetical protein ACR2NZ_19125 [Rubripirellula sp.]